jgi:histidyl-tRNA synthetase
MKYANKIGAKFLLVVGDNELETNDADLKNMVTGEKIPVRLDDEDFGYNFENIYFEAVAEQEFQQHAYKE